MEHKKSAAKKRSKSTRISNANYKRLQLIILFMLTVIMGTGAIIGGWYYWFETTYDNRVYPGVKIADVPVAGLTHDQITNYWLKKNAPFESISFQFEYEEHIATISGTDLQIGFDATLSATQALDIGRSGNWFSDLLTKYHAWKERLTLEPLFRWDTALLNQTLEDLSLAINIEPEDALFEFNQGRVTAFKTAKTGRELDVTHIKKQFADQLMLISTQASPSSQVVFALPVVPKEPLITTEKANDFGIKELIGKGESYYRGSIPGRIHNLRLAAARINGALVPPGKTFSFNQTVGDISGATGYKQAYIIKSGRTVLDDGGGVCQVSTTLFRAALDSGLPISERHAHSYRVSYYEQGGWKPGFDATIFAPRYDLKFVNDTNNHILVTVYTKPEEAKLVFELYGTHDGREVEISPVRLWDSRPAPPDLYQDDLTLPAGQIKQVDWANPGIKAAFDYTVRKNDEVLHSSNFYSNFIPWQAVYLRGTSPT